jgi:hypothetical protein
MADKKISALTSASTPLAGTEVLPIVQSGATVKVAVSNLTAGRAISATSIVFGSGSVLSSYEEGTWTPTVTAQVGSITSYTVNSATYTKIGRVVVLNFDFTITNNGTGSVANLIGNLPFNVAGGSNSSVGAAREIAVIGSEGVVAPFSTTQLFLIDYKNTYLGGTGNRIIGSLSYNA